MPVAIIPLFRAAIAAKGVPLVTLSCYHSTNHTPSVRPFGLPAPPPGSRVKPPLKGLAGVAVLDGVQLLNAKRRRAARSVAEGFAVKGIRFKKLGRIRRMCKFAFYGFALIFMKR